MTYIAGVDEAGRGPVIGPMVMCVVACKDEAALKRLGAADSKLLSPEQRERTAAALKEAEDVFYEIIELSPKEIDAAVQGKAGGDNLNRLEARTTALLIYRLARRVPLAKVIIDSPTRSTGKYERELKEALRAIDKEGITGKIQLAAEIKADYNHPVVGAASVLAKTTRDLRIRELSSAHGPLGSGYPADPDTQSYLQSHWKEGHDFFRKSWESYRRLAHPGPVQSSLADFGSKPEKHAEVIKRFEALKEHGFAFEPPTNQYEVVRMRNADGVTVISYTTGKLVVQGPDGPRAKAETLIASLGLSPDVVSKRPRGRPRKSAT